MRRWILPCAWLMLACGGRSSEPHWTASQGGAGGEAPASGGEGGAGGECQLDCAMPWPGESETRALDSGDLPLGNVSGATYAAADGVLWVVANIPGQLFRLVARGDGFAPDREGDWSQGKHLRFPGGVGLADAESVTLAASAADGLYVASEHDNEAASISRLSILHYDPSAAGVSLSATREWDVTSALPPVAANLGIEALTFVPDSLLAGQLYDQHLGKRYDPADYPAHGGGLFLVGVESTGAIHAFALNHQDGSFLRVFELRTPLPGVMSLEHDRETGYLWFGCDDACGNVLGVLRLDSAGRFAVAGLFSRPEGLPDSNHEGIAIGPEAECAAGLKPLYWVDDNALDGVTVRRGGVPCGEFL